MNRNVIEEVCFSPRSPPPPAPLRVASISDDLDLDIQPVRRPADRSHLDSQCVKCGGHHRKAYCPHIDCWYCGGLGHISTVCPSNQDIVRYRAQIRDRRERIAAGVPEAELPLPPRPVATHRRPLHRPDRDDELDDRPCDSPQSSANNIHRDEAHAPRRSRPKRFRELPDIDPSRTLYIGNLSRSVDEDDVLAFFSGYDPEIARVTESFDELGRVEKKFGWVLFCSRRRAKEALQAKVYSQLHGRSMVIRFTDETRDSELESLQIIVEQLRREADELIRKVEQHNSTGHQSHARIIESANYQMQRLEEVERRVRELTLQPDDPPQMEYTSSRTRAAIQPAPAQTSHRLTNAAASAHRPSADIPSSSSALLYPYDDEGFGIPTPMVNRSLRHSGRISPPPPPQRRPSASSPPRPETEGHLFHPERSISMPPVPISIRITPESASHSHSERRNEGSHAQALAEICNEASTGKMKEKLRQLVTPSTMATVKLLRSNIYSVLQDAAFALLPRLEILGSDARFFWKKLEQQQTLAAGCWEEGGAFGQWLSPFREVFNARHTAGLVERPPRTVPARHISWLIIVLCGEVKVDIVGNDSNITMGTFQLRKGDAAWIPAEARATAPRFIMGTTADACAIHFLQFFTDELHAAHSIGPQVMR